MPCRVVLSWAAARRDGSLDLLLLPRTAGEPGAADVASDEPADLSAYVSHPVQGRVIRQELGQTLWQFLGQKLPIYMVPSTFVSVPSLP